MLNIELTLIMITVVLDRSANNYAPSRETQLQEKSHEMPLHNKRNAMAQTSYWRKAYSEMRAVLEFRIKHTLESAFVVLKSRKQGVPCS